MAAVVADHRGRAPEETESPAPEAAATNPGTPVIRECGVNETSVSEGSESGDVRSLVLGPGSDGARSGEETPSARSIARSGEETPSARSIARSGEETPSARSIARNGERTPSAEEEREEVHEREQEDAVASSAEKALSMKEHPSLFSLCSSTNRVVDIQHAVLTAEINGRRTETCLDTGAGRNYIAQESLTEQEARSVEPATRDPPVMHAGGNRMRICGVVSMSLCIGSHSFGQITFRVAKSLPVTAVLGNEFITEHIAAIYPKSQWIRFDSDTITKFRVRRTRIINPLIQSPIKIRAVERVALPPATVTLVQARLDHKLGVPALVRRNYRAFAEHGLLPAQTLIPTGVHEVALLVGNFGREAAGLFPGQCFAECDVEEADKVRIVGILLPESEQASRKQSFENVPEELMNDELREKTKHLTEEKQCRLMRLLREFRGTVFGEKLGRTRAVQHPITTEGTGPIARPAYRQSPEHEKFAREESEKMLQDGLVSYSRSPWAAPVIIVKKPKGGYRFCTDFRALNKVTRKDAYPMPRSDVLLERLGGSHYFSTLDAERGFFQVEVRERDRPKTAFASPVGLLQYNVMPMGLINSPATFQRLMDIVLRGLHRSTACYIDDIIVFTPTFESHLKELEAVLRRLENAGLTLNLQKCYFAERSVEFLGHTVEQKGIRPNFRKTEAIEQLAEPTCVADIRRFLGLTGWFRKFIPRYAQRSRKLVELTKKSIPFEWTKERQEQWDDLRKALCARPVLKLPDFDRPFILDTDASKHQIGGVLMQKESLDDKSPRAIAYLSRALRGAELNYTVTEKEALAAIWCLKKLRHIIGEQEVTIMTDHAALRYFMTTTRDPYGRLARWSLALQDYNVKFVTRAGRKHLAGDALSRLRQRESIAGENMHEEVIYAIMEAVDKEIEWGYGLPSLEEVKNAQEKDMIIKSIRIYLQKGHLPRDPKTKELIQRREQEFIVGDDGLVRRVAVQGTRSWRQNLIQVLAPKSIRRDVMQFYHAAPAHAHLGIERTYLRIRDLWYWVGMQGDIARYVSRCPTCIKSKTEQPKKPRVDLRSIEAERPGQYVAMDLLGGLPKSWSNKTYIMVISDLFTKFARFISLPAIDTVTVADALLKDWILLLGAPENLLTDRGTQFTSGLFLELMKALEIKKIFTTAYHPQTDGQVERLNKTLVNMLRTIVDDYQTGWDDALPMAEWAYNTSIHASTGESPYFLTFKQDPPPFADDQALMQAARHLRERRDPEISHTKWAEDLMRRFKEVYERVRTRLNKARLRQKKNYDSRVEEHKYKEGELVYLYHPIVKEGQRRKLGQPWAGPFKIFKKVSPQNVELEPIDPTPDSKRWLVHINRLKPCPEGSLELYPLTREGVAEQLEEGFDLIKKITADRRTPDGNVYRVVWEVGGRTWEPEDNLPPAAIREYIKRKAAKNAEKMHQRRKS